jgi:hypothetical protein
MKLTTYLHLVSRLGMSTAVRLPSRYAFMVCPQSTFPLPLYVHTSSLFLEGLAWIAQYDCHKSFLNIVEQQFVRTWSRVVTVCTTCFNGACRTHSICIFILWFPMLTAMISVTKLSDWPLLLMGCVCSEVATEILYSRQVLFLKELNLNPNTFCYVLSLST